MHADQDGAAAAQPRERRTLYLRLTARTAAALEAAAAREGLRPWQLATRWVEAGLDSSGAAREGVLDDLRPRLDEIERRLAAVEAASLPSEASRSSSSRGGRPAVAARRTPGRKRAAPRAARSTQSRSGAARGARISLTDEITGVLAQAGEPLAAAAIAERINARGRYHPPRSGHALSANQVAARVSHAFYRDRFVRRDGRIGLARPAP